MTGSTMATGTWIPQRKRRTLPAVPIKVRLRIDLPSHPDFKSRCWRDVDSGLPVFIHRHGDSRNIGSLPGAYQNNFDPLFPILTAGLTDPISSTYHDQLADTQTW